MSDDRKVNLVVVAENQTKGTFQEIKTDAAGVGSAVEQAGAKAEAGLNRLGNAAGKAAEGLATAGKEATQAAGSLGGVGAGADAASQGVERASRNMIAAIQRATAELEAGKKGTASYYEAIARQRGVGSDVLEPYLAQLRKAEDAHKAVARSTQSTGASAAQMSADVARSLGGMDKSSIASAAHMDRLSLSLGSVVAAGAGLGVVTKLIGGIADAATKLPREGFNFAKDLEVSAVGMAGIIGSVTTLNGKQTQYNDALSISQGMILKLNDDALRTAASSKELVSTFQALLAPGLAAGMDLEQIRELTVVGANAVKSMGLGSHQLVQELRDLVAGGITASSSTLATSLGLKDSDIAKAKASSEGLFAFLMERLKGFEQSSEAFGNTLQGKLDQLKEGSIRAAADGMKPLTDAIGQTAGELSNLIIQVDGSKNVQINPQLVNSLGGISEKLVDVGGTVKNTLQGLWEYRDVVTGVVAAWGTFKVGSIASELHMAASAAIAKAEASRFAAVQSAAEAAANEAVTLTSTQKTAAYIAELQANVTRTTAQVAATSGTVAAAAAERAHALALTQLEAAQTAASRSATAFGAVVGALGGPVGIGVAALTGLYLVYKNLTTGAEDAKRAALSYQRAISQAGEGKAVDARDLSAMQQYVERLKEVRDNSLLAGNALQTYRDAKGELTAGKASDLNLVIANAEADFERSKLASQTAATSNAALGQTAAAAEAAWKKATEGAKTATNIQAKYKDELDASRRVYENFKKKTDSDATLSQQEKDSKLKEAAKAQDEYEAYIAKTRDEGIKHLTASETKAAAVAAKKQQREDNELAALKAKLSTAIELGAQLRGQLEADGTGAVYSKQTEGEKEAATWLAKANVQRDQKVKALMLEKYALAQQRGEQEKANKAMEDAIAVQQKQVASVQQRIQSLTKEAENLEAANAVYGKSEAAIESLNAQRAQDAVGIAMSLGDSQQLIDQLTEEWKATVRLNAAKSESRYKKSDEALDAGIVTAKAQAALYEDEYRLIGMSAVERAKIVALRKVEIDLAKELDKIDRSGLDDQKKAEQRAKAEEKAKIERSTAVNKVLQDDFFHTSGQIETSLTDALMRGFGRGGSFAQGLADEAERAFESMVLRPTFAAASRPVAGAITNAIGSFGNPANGQAGSGILGSVASSAIGTAITSGFAEVAAGYSGATLAAGLAGPTTAGATGAMGLGNMLAAVPGWGWALAGAAALLASGVGGSIGEVHSGAIYSTSSPSDMTTAMRVTQNDSAAARDLVDRANEAVSKPLEKVGKGLVKTFDDLAKMLGTASDQFDLTLGFAADLSGKSKDKSAFGYFDLVDKATGETLAAYKNRNLGENSSEAMTKLTNDASRAMLNALAKADIPAWAEHALGKLADLDGLDALAQFAAWPKTLLTQFGADRDALVQKFAEGMATGDAATAGQNVALSLVSSIEQTVMTAGAGQIFDTVNVGIITPMLDALATGASVSEALSQSSIDAVVQKATAQAQALNTLFTNVDFKAALEQIRTTVGGALGSAGTAMNYQPTYWQPDTNKSKEQSAAEKAAEDLAKRIKDALDGLKTDGLNLQIELFRAQGNDAAAALMELNRATEGWDAANRELYRQRLAENASLKEQIRAQQNLNTLRSDASTLAIDLLRAQGNESAALRAERDLAIKGWTDLEIAQYDVNAATRAQIQATTDLKTAMEALVGTADNVAEKFLSPDMLGQYRVQRITDQLNNPALGIGVDFSAQALDAIGIDGLKTVVLDFVRSDAGPQAKNAVLSLGASLLDLKLQAQAAADAVAATYTGADIKLLQAQGREQEALVLQRELDTRGMTAAQVAAYDYAHAIDQQITAMQEATAVAATRTGADIKLLQAQGDAQGALALQRELDTRGMTAAQVAAYDYAHAIDQQVTVMQQRQGLEQSIAQALGQTAILRERELAALDASNRPLQMRLYALTDAATAMDAAMSGVQRAVDADKNQISKSAAAQMEALRTGIDTGAKSITEAQNQVNTLTGLFDNIADAVKSLRGAVNPELDLLQARSYIDMSLSLARAGTLPDAKKLQDAISAVSKDNVDGYATVADFEFAQLVQAGKLDELGGLVGAQKSVQELQLDSMTSANKLAQDQISAIEKARDAQLAVLDEQLKSAQDQVSIAKGIDISVTSVATAMGALSASIAGLTAARAAAASAMPSSGGAGGGGASAASSGSAASTVDWGYTASPLSNYQQTGGTTFTDGNGTMRDIAGLQVPMGLLINASDVTGNLGAVRDYAVSNGLSAADVASAYQQIGRTGTTEQVVLDWAKNSGVPAFAAGGQHAGGLRVVGERGIEIEATGPARYWNAVDTQKFLGGGGGTSARLEQLFEQLLVRIEALEQQGVDAQRARDDLHDLLDKVTEGGNGMRVDLVAISEEKLEKWLTTSTQ